MIKTLLPIPPRYAKTGIRNDFIAALVVTSIAIPESLGFAALIGLPLETGLYTALFAPIVFAYFASTRRLVVGADSATASLIAAGAAGVAVGAANPASAVTVMTISAGIILLLFSLFRFGFLADLISRPVLVGFFAGVGVHLMIYKLPEMIGVIANTPTTYHVVTSTLEQLTTSNLPTIAISLIVLFCAFALPAKYPQLLIGLVVASVAATLLRLEIYGVQLVGALPSGLPSPYLPEFSWSMLITLLPTALSIALVILAQSSAVIRSQASEHDEKVTINTDLKALGFANIISGLTHGFAINGSPPRTLAADASGGKTQMVNVFMSLMIASLLLFGTNLLSYVPQAALASIVFAIGIHLIRTEEMYRIWKTHRVEFFIMLVTLASVALFGVRQGLLIAIVISLMERLRRQYHPSDQILLRDGKLSEWGRQRLGAQASSLNHPGLLVYSFDGSLFFENVEYFIARVERAIRNAKEPVDTVIIDTGTIEAIDYTAVDGLRRMHHQLKADNIILGFAHVSPALSKEFARYGIDQLVDADYIYPTLKAAIYDLQPKTHRTPTELVKQLPLPPQEFVLIGGAVMEILKLRTTNDIDMVVSAKLYERYRNHFRWKEFVHDDGKRVLSHNGYHMMKTWMNRDLKRLKSDAFLHEGVYCMSVAQLIACKQLLGRKKDISDIELLHKLSDRADKKSLQNKTPL